MSGAWTAAARALARRRLERSGGTVIPIRRGRARLGARRALRRWAIGVRSGVSRAATLGALVAAVAVTFALAEGLSLAWLAWLPPLFRRVGPTAAARFGAALLWALASLAWLAGVWFTGLWWLWRAGLASLLRRLASDRMLSTAEPGSDAPAYLRSVARPPAPLGPRARWGVLPMLLNWSLGLVLYLAHLDRALAALARSLWRGLVR
jgi:hypothetical protein